MSSKTFIAYFSRWSSVTLPSLSETWKGASPLELPGGSAEAGHSSLRTNLLTIFDRFSEHFVNLDDLEDRWPRFLRSFFASIEDVVGKHLVVRSDKSSDTASVPTAFMLELEALRNKVEELSDQVCCSILASFEAEVEQTHREAHFKRRSRVDSQKASRSDRFRLETWPVISLRGCASVHGSLAPLVAHAVTAESCSRRGRRGALSLCLSHRKSYS